MFPPIVGLDNPEEFSKITIIEGPDGSGKSTLIKTVQEKFKDSPIDLRVLRFPDNYQNVNIRDILMSKELEKYSSAQLFLFLADMVYSFESLIKPHLNDDNVRFVLDRFIPSSCIYQNVNIHDINMLFGNICVEFAQTFSQARYIYLDPQSFEVHKARLKQKRGDELNHLDPVTDTEIRANSKAYFEFARTHRRIGLLGSHFVETVIV